MDMKAQKRPCSPTYCSEVDKGEWRTVLAELCFCVPRSRVDTAALMQSLCGYRYTICACQCSCKATGASLNWLVNFLDSSETLTGILNSQGKIKRDLMECVLLKSFLKTNPQNNLQVSYFYFFPHLIWHFLISCWQASCNL